MTRPLKLSLIILTHRRLASVLRCLESLKGLPRPEVEVLVVLNGRDADNPKLLEELSSKYPWARALPLERKPRAMARNLALPQARGELIYFLDDDVIAPESFIPSLLATYARHPQAPALGGPHLGAPNPSDFQAAADFLLGSALGAGPMRARHSLGDLETRAPAWKFTLCNLGFKRRLFEERGLSFPGRFASAEENALLFQVERTLGRGVFSPDLYVYHERRKSLPDLVRQIYLCGRGRGELTRLAPRSLHPAVPAPLIFAAYLLSLPFLPRSTALLAPLSVYGVCAAVESARLLARRRRWRASLWLLILFPAAHFSYACGLLRGLGSRP